ncbi:MAG TPA: hypothetical protein VFH68_01370 [Polyangia bacterium]|nr:hypothetical protein [Polyangia bacterium]
MKSLAPIVIVIVIVAPTAGGCLLPRLGVGDAPRSDGGGDTASSDRGALGTPTGDSDGDPCAPVPDSQTVRWDFRETDQGVSADLGTAAWTDLEGCPAPGALRTTFTFAPGGSDVVLIGTQVRPAIDLTGGRVLYARVKILSGTPGLIQLVAKTGPCSIYSDGQLSSQTAADGWKVLALDPTKLLYQDDVCLDAITCTSVTCGAPGSSAYDPSSVTEIDVAIHAPNPVTVTPIDLVIDTIAVGN